MRYTTAVLAVGLPLHLISYPSSVAAFCSLTVSDRKIHVGNLDWTVDGRSTVDMLLRAVQDSSTNCTVNVTLKELRAVRKKCDRNKFHAGSAIVSFPTPETAVRGMQGLKDWNTDQSDEKRMLKLRWAPAFNSFRKRPPVKQQPAAAEVTPVVTPELLKHRKLRAERYARQRVRVAAMTDEVIRRVAMDERDSRHGNISTLQAPILNWDACPEQVDPVRGGGLRRGSERGSRKQAAVEAFLFVLKAALLDDSDGPTSVADLGCGAGNLAIPLAWWLQKEGYSVLGVDKNRIALDRLATRSKNLGLRVGVRQQDLLELVIPDHSAELDYNNKTSSQLVDCAAVVSLHACGMASDLAMAGAIAHSLPFAISPCCIGKVKMAWRPGKMPDLERNNGLSTSCSSIEYPRSIWLRQHLRDPDDYQLLASAADYGVVDNSPPTSEELVRRHRCRMAKRIVEMDRLEWARERGYEVRILELPRIGPVYPKRELLLGAKRGSPLAARIAGLPTTRLL